MAKKAMVSRNLLNSPQENIIVVKSVVVHMLT